MKEGWKYMKLGEIATDMYRGSGIRRDQITTNGSPCVRYGEIYTTYNYYFDKCVSHTDESTIAPKKYFEYGDILFAITGESVEEIGKSIAYLGNKKCLAGGDIIVMKHNQNPKYLAYALSSPNAIAQKGFGKTKLKVVHTNAPSLKNVSIPVPPLPEQQRIVNYLDTQFAKIDQLKANAEKQLQAAKDLFQAALKELLTPKDGWVEKKLGDYATLITKGASPKWQGFQYQDSGIPFITSENVRDGFIDISPRKFLPSDFNVKQKRSILHKNDVLVNIVGASIGRAAIFDLDYLDANINQAVALVRCDSTINVRFLCMFLNSEMASKQYDFYKKDSARANLSLENISSLSIHCPSLSEQQQIADKLDALSAKVKALQSNYNETITLCNDLKQSLLKDIFE